MLESDQNTFPFRALNPALNKVIFSKPHQVLQMELKKKSGKLILTINSKVAIHKMSLSFSLTKNILVVDHNIPHEFSVYPNEPVRYELLINEVKNPHLIIEASGIIPERGEEIMFLGNAQFYHIKIPESITDI